MAKPIITVTDHEAGFRLVKIQMDIVTPKECNEAVEEIADQLPGDRPVLINNARAGWFSGMLVHAAHPTPMVALYDPRLGYVVVTTHDNRWVRGQIIPDPEAS